ncbi:phage polarity suppression protein [Salmonella enterica subsp. enterica serovar Typhimurium]|nr:phage polarity suppression protein [Salmonella enterica subsp. enterica serovar Typhimurium]
MTTLTLQQACDACQTNKTAWLNRKSELAAAMQEYQELLLDDTHQVPADYRHCVT